MVVAVVVVVAVAVAAVAVAVVVVAVVVAVVVSGSSRKPEISRYRLSNCGIYFFESETGSLFQQSDGFLRAIFVGGAGR